MASLKRAVRKLNDFQRTAYDEAIAWSQTHEGGSFCAPMGAGKSLLALVLNLGFYDRDTGPGLFVATKTLIANIISEIEKHFPDGGYPYEVLHESYTRVNKWRPKKTTKLVITTHSLLARAYQRNGLRRKFVLQRYGPTGGFELLYDPPTEPLLKARRGLAHVFSRRWSCVLVDEIQKCCNIKAKNCQAICSIAANQHWVFSGTLLDNPKMAMIMGFLLAIRWPGTPRTHNTFKGYIRSDEFPGLRNTGVYREKNEAADDIQLDKEIITHPMHPNEVKIYTMFKTVVENLNEEIEQLKNRRFEEAMRGERPVGGDDVRRLSSSLMTSITYLRQSLVVPILPIATIAANMTGSDKESRTELTEMMHREINNLDIGYWLDSDDCMLSSRIAAALEKLEQHSERVVIFTAYRTSVRVLEYYIRGAKRKFYTLTSGMGVKKRLDALDRFGRSKRGVLCITFDIGSVGLNLQCASVVFIIDFMWTNITTEQAIARVARMGQKKRVKVYYFVCGAGVEKAVLGKQLDKSEVLDKLMKGKVERLVATTEFAEFINDIINVEDNIKLVDRLYVSKKDAPVDVD